MVGACTLDVATKSIVFPLGLNYYRMPQFSLPTGASPYTIYFRHERLNGNSDNHFYSNRYTTGSANRVFSGRYQTPNTLLDYWWNNDMVSTINSSTAVAGSLATLTWDGSSRVHYQNGSSIATQVTSGKNTISNAVGDVIGISGFLIENLNGEFKEMIVVKTGQSAAFIANASQTLTA